MGWGRWYDPLSEHDAPVCAAALTVQAIDYRALIFVARLPMACSKE